MKNIGQFLKRVNASTLTNNTQRVLHRLLSARGSWVQATELHQAVPAKTLEATTARVRDLRKDEFGSFAVECKSARDLKRAGGVRTYFYRINPRNVTVRQVVSALRLTKTR